MIKVEDLGKNNQLDISAFAGITGNFKIVIQGNNNVLKIGAATTLKNGIIEMRNHNSNIEIGEACVLSGEFRLFIGSETTMQSVKITLHEAGVISIGEDCMFSGDIRMDVSDMHSILDIATMKRINPPEDIKIGDHVWVGQGVYILKGVTIASHSIIGAKALVTKDIPAHSIAVGIPAKVIKTGVTWDRQRLPFDDSLSFND